MAIDDDDGRTADRTKYLAAADGRPDVEALARREATRLRRWMIATCTLWVIAAGYLVALWSGYMTFVHPAVHVLVTGPAEPDAERLFGILRAIQLLLEAYLAWPVLLFLAAACTTWLIVVSRRATLRQIQASLASITTQLSALATAADRGDVVDP